MRSTSHISISNLDSASSQRAREGARREQPGLCISRRKDADEDRTAERGRTTCLAGGRRGPRPTHSNTTHQSRNPPHTHITYHISPLEDQRGNPPGRGTEGKCRWAWASSLQGTCLGTGRAMTRYSRPVIRWDEGNEDTRRPHGIPWRLPLRTLRDPPPPQFCRPTLSRVHGSHFPPLLSGTISGSLPPFQPVTPRPRADPILHFLARLDPTFVTHLRPPLFSALQSILTNPLTLAKNLGGEESERDV
ncbi:hypothetical protein V8E36_004758 [Tilletia maclaganii]